MDVLPEPLEMVIKTFCHVEWYEVNDLAQLVNSGGARFDVAALRSQMEEMLGNPSGIAHPLNRLTANEFESDAEARAWLEQIYRVVFSSLPN